jgi:hypothetical protein
MADDDKISLPPMQQYKWVLPRSGVINEIYGNFMQPSWTLFDVRIRIGQLVPDDSSAGNFVAEEHAAVTFSWPAMRRLTAR